MFHHEYLQNELSELRLMVRRARQAQRSSSATLEARLDELEVGVGRVALLLRALAELTLERGLIRPEDLAAKIKSVDEADGAKDESLDPRVVLPGESKLADLDPLTTDGRPEWQRGQRP